MQKLNEIILETDLANGLHVIVIDNSKTMAADRWYITLTCRSESPLPPYKLAALDLDAEILAAFVEHMAGTINHVFTKERNFVDEKLKDEVVAEFLEQIEQVSLPYLAADSFIENLFQQNMDDFVQEYRVRQEMNLLATDDDDGEDDGPADFSACFNDN